MLDFCSPPRWYEPAQLHASSLISPHCPVRLMAQHHSLKQVMEAPCWGLDSTLAYCYLRDQTPA